MNRESYRPVAAAIVNLFSNSYAHSSFRLQPADSAKLPKLMIKSFESKKK